MTDKTITLIISDLHMGGGTNDPGDDFVYQDGQLIRWLKEQRETAEGKRGELELIINGDFLEMAQVKPEVYTLGSSTHWCSEPESLVKLDFILQGHTEIFQALRAFQQAGNRVTLAAGNHDVELYWPDIKSRLREVIGEVHFQLGTDWYQRYDGKLQISHGHHLDPANRFTNWEYPVSLDTERTYRLEMCPGTLFMVKFVNPLEHQYPFADNLQPVQRLAGVLWREDRRRFAAVSWLLTRFAARHPKASLGHGEDSPDVGRLLSRRVADNRKFFREVAALYREVHPDSRSDDEIRRELLTEDGLAQLLTELLATLPTDRWIGVIQPPPRGTLSIKDDEEDSRGGTLQIAANPIVNVQKRCRDKAEKKVKEGAEVVVIGHTHTPDRAAWNDGVYFNPGSWTRYVRAEDETKLKLADLRDEREFPYQLNFVRVVRTAGGQLQAKMISFEQKDGSRFRNPQATSSRD